jgi:hypothetical protein
MIASMDLGCTPSATDHAPQVGWRMRKLLAQLVGLENKVRTNGTAQKLRGDRRPARIVGGHRSLDAQLGGFSKIARVGIPVSAGFRAQPTAC